ncbi:MAG: hypothetical protein OXF88_02430 [Rhodobacteraceae bacterium]|nr:hypothetical protein [Paracoccaceae bacterium]MCY4141229.1 hypothetical protein [Paracoccaceae bacterium]
MSVGTSDESPGLLAACPGQKIKANAAVDSTVISAFFQMIEIPVGSEVTTRNIPAPHR